MQSHTPVEAFHPGSVTIAALASEVREDLVGLFPELAYEQTDDSIRTPLAGGASRSLVLM